MPYANPADKAAWCRRYHGENRTMVNNIKRRWMERNPEKRRAHNAVSNAIRDGRLERGPCEVCGSRAQAHHDDYSRPLDVRWLCSKHHAEVTF